MATVSIKVAEGTCADGCGATVNKGRTFKQGHDARLRSILGKAYRAGDMVAFNGTKPVSAESALKSHGFPIPPERKPRAPRKSAAKKPAAKKSTAKRTARKPRARKEPAAVTA